MKSNCPLFSTLAFILIVFNFAHAQNVGIGTPTPNAKLHVNGTFKVTDGTEGAGKVLTSDAAGMASWQPPAPPPSPAYYPTVSICCQTWMTRNLDVATYRNGDPIPKVTDGAAWTNLTTGAYCYYNNDSTTYAAVYGKLYNWYAVVDPRGLAPEGWHIPSDFEWTTMSACLGGDDLAGGMMKEYGTEHWNAPNPNAGNLANFTALGGGYRYYQGSFFNVLDSGCFWSSTVAGIYDAWNRILSNATDDNVRTFNEKPCGFSVRCIKD